MNSKKLRHKIKAPLLSLKYKMARRHSEGRIAIVGCGRSGTTYTSQLLQAHGYEIGHEELQRHGISSWCIVPNTAERCWGPSARDLEHLQIPRVHQIRHPLQVIASFTTAGERSWEFIQRFIPIEEGDSQIQKCMKYWLYWNEMAEKDAVLRYKVDEIEQKLPEIFSIAGFTWNENADPAFTTQSIPKDVNRRSHAALTWADLESEDPALTESIRKTAMRYGFEVA